jgi:hypothetical protein
MAACEKNLRHYAKTIADFERYRTDAAASLSQSERDEVEHYLGELRPFVGTIKVSANEQDARVYVDDELVGTTPLSGPLRVDIGPRRVRVSKDGFADWTTVVTVRGSEEMAIEGRIEKIVHEGRLVVRGAATDTIDVDGRAVGVGQFDGPLSSGGHQVRVRAEGMQAFQSEVLIQDNQTRIVDVTLQPLARGGVPMWAWIVGGAAVATGAAVGGYFLFKAKDEPGAPAGGTINPGFVTLGLSR